MTTTNKVQVGDTTGTSTSTTWRTNPVPPPTEYGWACPRCNRINAPWVRQCDCGGNNYLTITVFIFIVSRFLPTQGSYSYNF